MTTDKTIQQNTAPFTLVEIKDPGTCNRIEFRFGEFNPRSALRRAPAARVYIDQFDGQGEFWLWMDKKHLAQNIKEFGEHPELLKAQAAYKGF